jgi:hypothetical protein
MLFCFSCLLLCAILNAQTPKRVIAAVRTTQPIKIDGDLADEVWKTAPLANNFIEQRPQFGKLPGEKTKTEVYILYDDNAVYIAGFCYETSRDSIATELVGRDRIGINDFAGVMFDTYQDEINGVGFYVTALGEQYDCKYALGNEDGSWSTVYQTATKIMDNGWSFEMMIPYYALRFSKETVQSWGVNFVRRRSKTGQQYMWNPVDPNKFGMLNQAGTWKGIENIKAPIRLSFSPYFSTYLNGTPNGAAKKNWNTSVNGGMDVKYGISKGFTLDMTLIPDFGQVQSDNQVLNLTPFEVRFNENRTFFTEGTELFNKGNLFYSRRVGGTPLHYGRPYSLLGSGERIVSNPSETKLINGTKISGRTAKGLGIGFFNAIINPQYARIETASKEEVEVETNPLTNYNILVLDQTMKNNSSVSLVNTNVLRSGADYDANVTAALWDIYDNQINWNFWGKVANSRLFDYAARGSALSGYNYELNLGKFKGPFNFEVYQHMADDKYNQNDMGYFTNNNYFDNGMNAWYKFNKPKGIYNNIFIRTGLNYSQRFKPRAYQDFSVNLNANSQLKSLWSVGVNVNVNPEQQDFYEPRKADLLFKRPGSWRSGLSVSTNGAKKYAASLELFERVSSRYKANATAIFISNRYRFNDRLTISLSSYNETAKNDVGFAFISNVSDSVIFGLRNRTTLENIFIIKYNFNIKMGLNFRARHYWSKVAYHKFLNLKNDGYLEDVASVNRSPDNNANYFNIDMVYTWQFAPGSFLNVGWKNDASLFNNNTRNDYYHNLKEIVSNQQQNIFSVKVICFLDYITLRRKLAK